MEGYEFFYRVICLGYSFLVPFFILITLVVRRVKELNLFAHASIVLLAASLPALSIWIYFFVQRIHDFQYSNSAFGLYRFAYWYQIVVMFILPLLFFKRRFRHSVTLSLIIVLLQLILRKGWLQRLLYPEATWEFYYPTPLEEYILAIILFSVLVIFTSGLSRIKRSQS